MRSHERTASEQAIRRCRAQDDPHDEIASDVLELWIGISRLLGKVTGNPDQGAYQPAAKAKKPPSNKKPRRKAA